MPTIKYAQIFTFQPANLSGFFIILNPKNQNAFLNRTNKMLLYKDNILFYYCSGLSFTQSLYWNDAILQFEPTTAMF